MNFADGLCLYGKLKSRKREREKKTREWVIHRVRTGHRQLCIQPSKLNVDVSVTISVSVSIVTVVNAFRRFLFKLGYFNYKYTTYIYGVYGFYFYQFCYAHQHICRMCRE